MYNCISSLIHIAGLELLLSADHGAAGFRELSTARPRCCGSREDSALIRTLGQSENRTLK